MRTSFPKHKINVLLLENIHTSASELFEEESYNVKCLSTSLSESELIDAIQDCHILGIRSKTHVTKKVLEHANVLWAIGTFCVGVNQVDLNECLAKGVAVFNAPFSNTRSVVELALGEMIALVRQLPVRSKQLHQGVWRKSAAQSYELRGKKLGIIGYGNIGSQLSVLSESLGMDVYYYDVTEKLALGNAKRCHVLEALLSQCDIITLHIDGREDNAMLMGEKQFGMMKEGAYFLNLSRGHVVDLEALADAIKSGHIAGCGVDVYPEEPKGSVDDFTCPLQGLPNVILTPHVGGSTEEAQHNIAKFVPKQIINYINRGDTSMSVNFPQLQLNAFQESHRLIHIHHNEPGVLANINQQFAASDINIVGQYLMTNNDIGYVITDIQAGYQETLFDDLKKINGTIRLRVLY